jgi:isopenicillin N synthase-like dioxygenase
MAEKFQSLDYIPEIDIKNLLSESSSLEEKLKIAREIVDACKRIGFFSIVGHGIHPSLIQEALKESRLFFNLPADFKMNLAPKKWNPKAKNVYRGYFPSLVNGKEGYDLGNPFFASNYRFRKASSLHENSLWPTDWEGFSHFKSVMVEYYHTLQGLGRDLLRAISMALLGPSNHDYFEKSMSLDRCVSTLRLNYYPQQDPNYIPPESTAGGLPLSCETHTDGGILTILYQDMVGGLQVQNTEGNWVDVPVNPNAFLVNIGLCLQQWTNNQLIATNHRVLFTRKERFSIPFFVETAIDAVIDCRDFARASNSKPLYPPKTYEELILESMKRFKEYQRQEEGM